MSQIAVFDLETTGVDVEVDRIVSLGIVLLDWPLNGNATWPEEYIFNPGILMKPEVVALHGITNEVAATHKPFSESAHEIFDLVKDKPVAGFNVVRFDMPMLWNEFNRCGINWNVLRQPIIDAGTLFVKREPRTLKAAMKFYCDDPDWEGHSAAIDASATGSVLASQIERYGLQGLTLEQLEAESLHRKPLDIGDNLMRREDGVIVYSFGKHKGTPVIDQVSYAKWMIDNNFNADTKRMLLEIITPKPEVVDDYSNREGEF